MLRKSPYEFPIEDIKDACNKLGLSDSIALKIKDMLEKIKKKILVCEGVPRSWIAASLYIIAIEEGEKRRMQDVCMVIGITSPTVQKRYNRIMELKASGKI